VSDVIHKQGSQREPLRFGSGSHPLPLLQPLEWLEEQISALDEGIGQLLQNEPDWAEKIEILQSVPGIGMVTAATLVAELPFLGQASHKEIAALAGVAQMSRDSGRRTGKRHITGGRLSARRVLYMATVAVIRCNPVIRAFHLQLLAAGKEKKVTLVACMRKLLTLLNALPLKRQRWNRLPPHPKTSLTNNTVALRFIPKDIETQNAHAWRGVQTGVDPVR